MLCSINIFIPAPIKGKYSNKYNKNPRIFTILTSNVIHCVAIQKLHLQNTALTECTRIYFPSQKPNFALAQIVYTQSNYLTKKKKNPLVHDYLSKFVITEKAQSHYLFIKVIGKHFNRKINELLGNAGLYQSILSVYTTYDMQALKITMLSSD